MSKEKENNPGLVTELLCEARRDVLVERIEGLKKAIYVSAASITTIIVIMELLLKFFS